MHSTMADLFPSQAGRRLSREDLILISGYGVWPLFNNSIAAEAGGQCHQVDIDCSRAADRAFWQTMPVNVAKRWGGRMPKIARILSCHPAGEGAWCLDVISALIEGHTEGRTAMVAEKRAEAERRGESADIPDGSLTTIAFEAVELNDEDMPSEADTTGTSFCRPANVKCMDKADGPAAAAAAGVQGGAADGSVRLRDVIDQLDSMTSQMAACTEAAKLSTSQLDDNTEDRGRLADALKTFSDAHSTLRNELTHILAERLTLRAPRYKVGSRVSVAAEERRGDSVWVTAAVYDTKETNGGTVVFMREVEGREENLKPVTVPDRTKPPPQHNQDLRMGGKTFSWKGKRDGQQGGAVSSVGTTTKAQQSTPVVSAGAGRRLSREDLILISGYGVWPLFNNSIAKEAGAQCRQVDIDCSRAADRAFWQAMPVNVAMRWGGRMPKLTRILSCHPAGEGAWCLDVISALIEGHTEGRAAMVAEKRAEAERRGEAADIPDGSLTTIAFEAAELSDGDMPSVGRINPALPSVSDPPPSLPALTSISGLTRRHRGIGNRGWRAPSLERVQAHEHVDTLGPLAGRRLSREDLILISGYGVWPLFNNSIAAEAGGQCHQVDIDCSRAADRAFWQTMPVNVAKRWGGRMPKIARILSCHPAGEGAWCLDVISALIEGHTEGRTAMVAEKRAEAERRGESADIPDGSLTTIAFEAVELNDEDMPSVRRTNPTLPPLCAPPPSLPALTSISGLTAHHHGIGSRGWRVPSLERVQAHEHVDTLRLLVGSSRCLRVFDVPSTVDQKAEVLQEVPVAAEEGQPGPLANLEDIGPIEVPGDLMTNQQALVLCCTQLQELGLVLQARGCRRSLKSLKVKFVDEADVDHEVFEFAEALQTFASAVCVGDVPISFTSAEGFFSLMTLHSSLFPAAPSPVLKTLMRQLADQATVVGVDLMSDLATPPTPAVLDMARRLAFNKATRVHVFGVDQPAQAAPAPSHPALAIIHQMQPMPQASTLVLGKHTALAAGTQPASKMPNLRVLSVQDAVPMDQALQAIKAIGCERELDMVTVGDIRGVGSGGIDIGEHREGFPQITKVLVELTVPAGVSDFVEFACSSMRSLLQLNCETVALQLLGMDAHTRSLLESAVPAQLGSGEGTIILCSQQDSKLTIGASIAQASAAGTYTMQRP
ncbi:unnamed protein product [Vitrella brassicaformis CCMP3155]|uniref:Uncharacterized protein n=1 Tax=Vitrella brassicaformis (strain CCMP3155) TaxID=1169540 RepID=A0A0G4GRS5_VITBC|nr:unnamed protein product [Vitrella brassicaformis CCMP3155]|eukprot:CEM33054.1 unnamed protein product [Vitrella brassicaformis CCMP3155]